MLQQLPQKDDLMAGLARKQKGLGVAAAPSQAAEDIGAQQLEASTTVDDVEAARLGLAPGQPQPPLDPKAGPLEEQQEHPLSVFGLQDMSQLDQDSLMAQENPPSLMGKAHKAALMSRPPVQAK